jgi:hypothetical protein
LRSYVRLGRQRLVVEVLAPADGKAIHPKVWLRVEIAVHT